LRTLVILTIAIGAALLIASHPAIALPVGVGVTILAILTKITGD
jgi:ABC-type microcin C transport system duplicated ATPase subunit YejF